MVVVREIPNVYSYGPIVRATKHNIMKSYCNFDSIEKVYSLGKIVVWL